MIPGYSKSSSRPPWRLLLGILCIALIVFGAILQAAHTHAHGNVRHADCSLCATAHVVIQAAVPPAPLQVATVVSALPGLPLSVPVGAVSTFALFTRPPPSRLP